MSAPETDQLFRRKTRRMDIMSIIAVMFRSWTSSASASSLRLKAKIRFRLSRWDRTSIGSQHARRKRNVREHELALRVLAHDVHRLDDLLVRDVRVRHEDDVVLV